MIFADFFALDLFDLKAFENSVSKSAHGHEG
jgi:hypothetical protein